jgi:hypothetical protein
MSICAVSLADDDRALVVVDTCTEVHGHPGFYESAKVHLLPHAGLVLAGLGQGEVTDFAFHRLHRPGRGIDFDLVSESMRGILEGALHGVESRVNAKLPPEWYGGNLAFLVGWSRSAGRMQARAYLNAPGASNFTVHEIPRWSVHPRDPSAEISAPTTIEEIAALARGAVAYGKSTNPDYPYGGRIVIADIRRDCISTHVKEIP